jgi:putative nucleotidyltransferase with HDIG domain
MRFPALSGGLPGPSLSFDREETMSAEPELVALDASLTERQAEELLRSITIPSCPAILTTLMHEARQDDVDFPKIVRLIASDVGLAASVLKTANSPFFALRSKVQNVQQAMSVLGLKNLISIITSVTLLTSLSPPGVNMERFWDRSGYAAAVCSHIARVTRSVNRDLAYTFGLFHDCGIPILMQRFPDYKQTLAQANDTGEDILNIEYARHATNHAIVGSMLARNWQLPVEVVQAIALHHEHELLEDAREGKATGEVRALIAICHIAAYAVARFLDVREDREWVVHGGKAMGYLGLDADELTEMIIEIKEQLSEIRDSKL